MTEAYGAEQRLVYAPAGSRFPEASDTMKVHENAGDDVPVCGTPLPDTQHVETAPFRLGSGLVTCLRCARVRSEART